MRPRRATEPANRFPTANERGAILAEFALVMPVLLVILFGIIEFGLAFSRSQSITAAAREGGRLASLSSSTTTDISNRVDATLGSLPFDAPPTVTVIPPGGCAGREGEPVTVTVSAPHRITIPFALDRQITLSGQAVFRCEA
ncbi:MAG: TadE/TadG family type IV pilus assembly protein [Acidimicrobiales bacterium]